MPSRNNLFYRKYKKSKTKKFYIFGCFPTCKSEFYVNIDRKLHFFEFKRLNLPSYFKIVKEQDVQGPRIHIIYSSTLNFVKLKKICSLKKFYDLHLTHFKLNLSWYAYNLLDDLKIYKTSLLLCDNIQKCLNNKTLKLSRLTLIERKS